jgi:hypothetical protein
MVRKVETGFPRFPDRSGSRKKILHQSFDAAGTGAPGGGASCTGADACLGTAGFLAAASALLAAAAGRGGDALAAGGEAGVRGAAGSGVMILTGGVDAAEGKSALVGLPVGIVGARAATAPGVAAGGKFHSGA